MWRDLLRNYNPNKLQTGIIQTPSKVFETRLEVGGEVLVTLYLYATLVDNTRQPKPYLYLSYITFCSNSFICPPNQRYWVYYLDIGYAIFGIKQFQWLQPNEKSICQNMPVYI